MSAAATRRVPRSDWGVAASLLALSLVPALAGIMRLLELAGGAAVTEANARFFAAPLPVVLHILTVVPFSVLGALQLVPSVRRRWPGWHRAAGRWLMAFGMVAALTGLWMAHFYDWPAADGFAVYLLRLVFGTAMVVSIVMATVAVRRRRFAQHGAWMIRAYAIGLGAGTQVLTHLPWVILVGEPAGVPRAVFMGAGWVINVVVAEWVVRGRRSPARALASAVAPTATLGRA